MIRERALWPGALELTSVQGFEGAYDAERCVAIIYDPIEDAVGGKAHAHNFFAPCMGGRVKGRWARRKCARMGVRNGEPPQ